MTPRRLALLVGLSALMGLAACGAELPPPWKQGRRWGLSQKEFVAVHLPAVRNPRRDLAGDGPRLVVNLLPSGYLLFKGYVWPLRTGSAAERAAALEALRSELVTLTHSASSPGDASTVPAPPLLLHADRAVRWSDVRDVIDVARAPPIAVRRLQWAVRGPSPAWDWGAEGELSEHGAHVEGARPTIEIRTSGDAFQARVLMAGAETGHVALASRGFPVEAGGLRGRWDAVAPQIELPDGLAVVRVEEDAGALPWVHVVHALDVLLGAGARDVAFPNAGFRLRLTTPDDTWVPPEDDPVAPPLVIVLCVLAAVLAFALNRVPRGRRNGDGALPSRKGGG